MSKPIVAELQEILHDLVEWELVAIHFRGFNEIEIEKIKKEFKNTSLEEQKLSLYSRWLTLCPDAKWDDVVSALEKGKQITLAEKVKNEKVLNATKQKGKQIIFSFEEEEEELIKELKQINHSFTLLLRDVRIAIENLVEGNKNSLQKIVEYILDAKIEGFENLRKCQTTSELNEILRKNCNFLDGSILDRVVEYGFPHGNDGLKCRTREHMDKIKVFKSKAPLKLLKKTLKEEIHEDSIHTTLIVTLNNDWDKVTFNHVEKLILALAGTYARAVRVNNGSVEITFMISRDKVMSFNITPQKRQLLCLIGVFYLQVGDERLFIEDENMNYTFENGLLEAGKVGHTQATEFILNMNIVNINYQDNEGKTALMLASEHGHIEVLKLILSAGANVNIQDKYGRTAVMVAKTLEIYRTLEANADTSIVTHNGSTPLMVSCLLGNHEVANHLLYTLSHEITTRPDGMTLLMAACLGGNQRIVEHLLINGVDPNLQNHYGETAIWLSCFGDHYTVTEILLKHSNAADPNISDNDGWTPLMVASEKGHYEIVTLLLMQTAFIKANQNGQYETVYLLLVEADPNISDKDGWTPLMIASENGHHKIVEVLLQNEVNPHITDYEYEKSALVLASENGHNETVKIILEFTDMYMYSDNDYDSFDHNFQKAMELSCLNGHYAVTETLINYNKRHGREYKTISVRTLINASRNGHYEIVQLLLKYSYYLDDTMDYLNYLDYVDENDDENDYMMTALMLASENGHNDIVDLLLAHGANPDELSHMECETAIFLSSLNGHYEVTQTLLKYQSDLNITNFEGWTALTAASYNGHLKIVELLLLKEKFDPNFTDYKKGPSALMMASLKGHLNIIELLLSNGANPNIQDKDGVTAIWLSCNSGHYLVTETLLKHKADPNVCASDKYVCTTPMMVASRNGHHKIVQMLLVQEKINPNIADNNGATALILASQNGHSETVELLLSNGADPNIQKNNGITALWLSCFNGHYT